MNALSEFHGTVLDIACGQMPYRSLVTESPSRAERYVGMDLKGGRYGRPDVEWDGAHIPLDDSSVDSAMATEVLEHCPDPGAVLRETRRILKPGGFFFFTVPFIWPLHCVPFDHYRYTPFAMERLLREAGFSSVCIHAMGGWDASLAQMFGLWIERRPMPRLKKTILARLAVPVMRRMFLHDISPKQFEDSSMISGLAGSARS